MSVLDVGCGSGAITRGIAEAVGSTGVVVGVDRDRGLIERARLHGASLPNLRFEERDATGLDFDARFDVVTAARTLQWIADARAAIRGMRDAARPGGLVVVLDYNHVLNAWEPAPPGEFAAFYAAFLAWRESNGWDNQMGDHCPALFEDAGLLEIRSQVEDETSVKGEDAFDEKTAIWIEVIDRIGPSLESAQTCEARLLAAARRSYDAWRRTALLRQTLSLRATVARVPGVRWQKDTANDGGSKELPTG